MEAAGGRAGGGERSPAYRAARHDESPRASSGPADGLSQAERSHRAVNLRTVGRRSAVPVATTPKAPPRRTQRTRRIRFHGEPLNVRVKARYASQAAPRAVRLHSVTVL